MGAFAPLRGLAAPCRCVASARPRPLRAAGAVGGSGAGSANEASGASRMGKGAEEDPERRKNVALYRSIGPQGSTGTYRGVEEELGTRASGRPRVKPEVLSPAGGWEQLRAAVENGCDAVYFGVEGLNARARAANFTLDELPEVMTYLHDRGVKGYATMNVLIFEHELPTAEKKAKAFARAGVDAVIVQDVGACEVLRRAAPSLPLHGSTQMSITSGEGAEFSRRLGTDRIVVGRELSAREIAQVAARTDAEIEAFVHGALCVSYSGQCWSSESWGGRSANRGQCAQACRMPYGLIVDGRLREMGDFKYLLSPQDLMALDLIPELIEAGVTSLKIEGRLKGPEYVAVVTRAYRDAVDAAWAALSSDDAPATVDGAAIGAAVIDEPRRLALRQVFARGQDEHHDGLTQGFLGGVKHQTLVGGAGGGVVWVELLGTEVKKGDGVVFDVGDPEREEAGGAVCGLRTQGGARVEACGAGLVGMVVEGAGAARLSEVEPGALVWRTRDTAVESAARASFDAVSDADRRRAPVVAAVEGRVGEPLTLRLTDPATGVSATAATASPLTAAQKRPLDRDAIAAALGPRLGGGPLRLASLDVSGLDDTPPGVFLPVGEVKDARRRAVDALVELRRHHPRADGVRSKSVVPGLLSDLLSAPLPPVAADAPPAVRILCRTPEQVAAAIEVPWLDEITLDFLEAHGLEEWVRRVQRAGKRAVAAAPRVLKPGEQRLCDFYLGLGADALLVRSAGLLQQLHEYGGPGARVTLADGTSAEVPPLLGDFSLNAANSVAAALFLREGLERLAPTHDLNAHQIANLARSLPADLRARIEAVCHQHLAIFHTEHCVFCRFLSSGNSYRDCGHPCERHHVHLRDGAGKDHLVLADMGCRNTVFDAQAQSGARHLAAWVAAGIRSFRVELVDEAPDAVAPILDGYRAVLEGRRSEEELMAALSRLQDRNGRAQGVGEGSLAVRAERDRATLNPTAATKRAAARAS
ncbi:unnamed protein product [Pedinophyceae sp. YPF-701]|nr:unnamed protein product [Pedinophyceae sp. YPF-701]